ncbi:MAG: hypothetical protein ACYCXT_03785 [Acidiferrobacteraceae bacterium]
MVTYAQRIFTAENIDETRIHHTTFITHFDKTAPKTPASLEEGSEDVLNVLVLTKK